MLSLGYFNNVALPEYIHTITAEEVFPEHSS